MFGVPLDGLDDQVQFVGAVDFPGHAVVFAWGDQVRTGEVVEAVDPAGRVVLHEEHDTAAIFHPGEQQQMIGAEVEHADKEPESGSREAPAPAGSAVEGLPGGLLRAGYRHRAAHGRSQSTQRLFRRRLALVGFAEAFASEQEDFRVLHQAIGDGGGDGGVVEDIAPVGEGGVGRNQRAAVKAVASGDDLIEQIGSLLIEGKVAEFVDQQQCGVGVELEFADQRVIDLRSQQMVEHVHGGGEQDALPGLAGAPADDLGQEGLAHAGIADEADVGALRDEVQIEQAQDAVFELEARLVMVELEAVDGMLGVQAGELEAALDGALRARASSSRSTKVSRVWATLRLRVAASVRVGSSCWLMIARLSCSSFCCSGVIGRLLGVAGETCRKSASDKGSVASSLSSGFSRRSGGCTARGRCCWRRILAM